MSYKFQRDLVLNFGGALSVGIVATSQIPRDSEMTAAHKKHIIDASRDSSFGVRGNGFTRREGLGQSLRRIFQR